MIRWSVVAGVLVSLAARAEGEDAGDVVDADAGVVEAVVPLPPPIVEPKPLLETPARVHLSEYLLSAYHIDNGNVAPRGSAGYDPTGGGYVDWLNRLQLDAAWNQLTATVRIDSALYGNTPVAAPGDAKIEHLLINRYANRLDFEKASITYAGRYLEVTLGDTYATYGRGLVLSLRKVDEFAIDTTVRGLSATAHVGGFTLNALGGWSNILNVDPATGREANDPNDVILGTRAEYRIGRWVTAGFDASHVIYSQSLLSGGDGSKDQVTSFSGTLELPHLGSWGTFYAELAGQRRLTSGDAKWFTAFYATASVYLGPVTLLAEFKDYRNYSAIPTSLDPTQVPELALTDFYTAAPTLERVNQLVLNNTDVAGGHVRASIKVAQDFVPFVSMAAFVDRIYRTQIYDPYLGLETRWNDGVSRASASGGYRLNQYADGSQAPGSVFQGAAHVELDVNQHLSGPYSVELSGLHYSHRDWQGDHYNNWLEGQVYLSFKRAQLFSVAAGFEYYTEAPQTIRSTYFNGSVTWNVIDNLLVRAFVGGQRAGIKCVNGVCRNYPAFDGVRVEVLARY